MPNSERVERRIWWFTVSKAADRSRRMRAEERELALALIWRHVTYYKRMLLGSKIQRLVNVAIYELLLQYLNKLAINAFKAINNTCFPLQSHRHWDGLRSPYLTHTPNTQTRTHARTPIDMNLATLWKTTVWAHQSTTGKMCTAYSIYTTVDDGTVSTFSPVTQKIPSVRCHRDPI
jgi:hypothetical protein